MKSKLDFHIQHFFTYHLKRKIIGVVFIVGILSDPHQFGYLVKWGLCL